MLETVTEYLLENQSSEVSPFYWGEVSLNVLVTPLLPNGSSHPNNGNDTDGPSGPNGSGNPSTAGRQ